MSDDTQTPLHPICPASHPVLGTPPSDAGPELLPLLDPELLPLLDPELLPLLDPELLPLLDPELLPLSAVLESSLPSPRPPSPPPPPPPLDDEQPAARHVATAKPVQVITKCFITFSLQWSDGAAQRPREPGACSFVCSSSTRLIAENVINPVSPSGLPSRLRTGCRSSASGARPAQRVHVVATRSPLFSP
jgi:hypothetical protein